MAFSSDREQVQNAAIAALQRGAKDLPAARPDADLHDRARLERNADRISLPKGDSCRRQAERDANIKASPRHLQSHPRPTIHPTDAEQSLSANQATHRRH